MTGIGGWECGDDPTQRAPSKLVLIRRHLLQPRDVFAIETLLDSDVCHALGRRRAMPMLHIRRNPHDVALLDALNGPAPLANTSAAGNHNECLAQWMRMPCSACTGFEGHCSPVTRAGSSRANCESMRTAPVNRSGDPFVEGCEPLRATLIRPAPEVCVVSVAIAVIATEDAKAPAMSARFIVSPSRPRHAR